MTTHTNKHYNTYNCNTCQTKTNRIAIPTALESTLSAPSSPDTAEPEEEGMSAA